MKKAAIIHGTKGSPDGNWFKDLALQLEGYGYQAFIPRFPTPDGQNLDNWLSHFALTVGQLDQTSILIGHSVGAVFALRLLEQLACPIAAAVLVAGFTGKLGLPEYDDLNASFVASRFNWQAIRSNASHIVCISGDSDPYVPFEQAREIADSFGVEHLIIQGGGHLNAEFGYTRLPQVIAELTKVGVLGK